MTPFTATWTLFLVGLLVATVVLWAALRGRADATQRWTLFGIAVGNWAISTWFTFDRIGSGAFPDFVLSRNWPLHFCTICTFLLIPAMLATKRQWWAHPLQTLLFFPGALAAFLALVAPGKEYEGDGFWVMGTLFYAVHGLNVLLPFVHAGLGLYRPRWRDAALSLVWFTILALGVLVATLLCRAFVDPAANYMYFFDPEGSGILVLLWNLIGIPVVYEIPLLFILYPVLLGFVAAQRGIERLPGLLRRRRPFAQPA
ncbi:MAG: YwaF family protein [Microbacteriaceae bacterium]|nr:YwaF family protein [Microbacteriaceae bacterium]